jgi:hypothetical protein
LNSWNTWKINANIHSGEKNNFRSIIWRRKNNSFAVIQKLLVDVEPLQGYDMNKMEGPPVSNPEKYVPPEVERVLNEQQLCHISQLRRVTTLFINLMDIDITVRTAAILLNGALSDVQKAVCRYEGSLNKYFYVFNMFLILGS